MKLTRFSRHAEVSYPLFKLCIINYNIIMCPYKENLNAFYSRLFPKIFFVKPLLTSNDNGAPNKIPTSPNFKPLKSFLMIFFILNAIDYFWKFFNDAEKSEYRSHQLLKNLNVVYQFYDL